MILRGFPQRRGNRLLSRPCREREGQSVQGRIRWLERRKCVVWKNLAFAGPPELLKALRASAVVLVQLIPQRVLLGEVLMILFRRVELGSRHDLGEDGASKRLGLLHRVL